MLKFPKKELDKFWGLCILYSEKGTNMVRTKTGMKRVNFYLSKIQIERLDKLSEKTGLSASEILRRAIDDYWEKQNRRK